MGIFDSLNDELNNDSVDDSGNESENNEPLPKFIEMALAIMGKGIPIDAKLLKDPKALKELYEKVILGQEPNPTTPDENDIFRGIMQGLPGTPSDEITEAKNLFSRLMKIARQVDYKGAVDLADGIDRVITAQFESYQPNYEVADLLTPPVATPAATPPGQEEMLEPDPSLEDEDFEENIVSPKDLDDLVNKLESVLDAAGEDFDSDLIAIAKKIIKEIAEKLDQVNVVPEEVAAPEEAIATEEASPSNKTGADKFHEQLMADLGQSEQPGLPQTAVAHILTSTVKLAMQAEKFDVEDKDKSLLIDSLILDIDSLLQK